MKVTKVSVLALGAVVATAIATWTLAPTSTGQVADAAIPTLLADSVKCDLAQYKGSTGLTAEMGADGLQVSWNGQGGAQLRAQYAIADGSPIVRELAIRKAAGKWVTLGQNLTPEYQVVTAIRRLPTDQGNTLRNQGIDLTQEVIDKHRWYAFWDSPLSIPGHTVPPPAPSATAEGQSAAGGSRRGSAPPVPAGGRVYGLPRKPEDVRRGTSVYNTTSCQVKTDGSSLAVTFPGLKVGIFDGSLRFTVYRGANLVQMDALARTDEPWVAYKYDAGLKGLTTAATPRVMWRDTGGHAQQHQFGGPKANGLSGVRAQNRLLVAEGAGGSLAVFPPPHTFFFTRELDVNLGYVFYRNDGAGQFTFGVTMPERETDNSPNGTNYAENYALYNAPPGTEQKMSVFFYANPEGGEATRTAALAFTRGDTFKPIDGYKTFVNHFHLRVTDRMRVGGFDRPLEDLMAMKALGLNVIGLSDFHADRLAGNDYGPARFRDQKDYAEASRRLSDKDFLVVPWEEPSVAFGGHYNAMWPKNVFWSKTNTTGGGRGGGQAASEGAPAAAGTTLPFTENDPTYGTVYHTGSAEAMQRLLDAEGGYWYHAHPRTKSTANYPDAIWDRDYIRNDRYLGVAFKPGMGLDLSDKTLCEYRCFDTIDTMNNAFASLGIAPKYVIADIDTYRKGPEDDLYANFPVNYLKIPTTPGPDQDWSPVLKAMHEGNFFVTTGEILIRNYAVTGTGAQRTISADAEWTFPMTFMEIVTGDGKTVHKQVISATDMQAFGTKKLSIPFDATGKKWVRFAMWDVAGNGAFTQPQWLTGGAAAN